jgi:hypothetical protein
MSSDENSQQANYNISALSLKPRRRIPGFSHQVSKTVDGMKDNCHALSSDTVAYPEGGNNSDGRHTESPSQMTPRAQRGLDRELGDEDKQTIIANTRAENNSFLFKTWLWFQFAVVVLFFIFSMARKGPGSVLGHGSAEGVRKERRVVAGR